MRLQGKTAFITGAASGFGKAFTLHLLHSGCKVFGVDLNEKLGNEFENECTLKFGKNNMKFLKCDVADHPQLKDAFYTARETFHALDIVCNNAGIANITHRDIMKTDNRDVAKKMLDINLKAVIEGTYIGLDIMSKSNGGNGGVIINIGSIAGLHVMPLSPIYTASKHGVVSFTHCFKYIETDGVRINCLCPNIVATPLNMTVPWFRSAVEKGKIPLAKVEDVVTAFVQCIEDESLNGDALAIHTDRTITKYEHRVATPNL